MATDWRKHSYRFDKNPQKAPLETCTEQTLAQTTPPTDNGANVTDIVSTQPQDARGNRADNQPAVLETTVCIECDAVLDIASVFPLYEYVKDGMQSNQSLVFDTRQVERVDMATLPLFAALFHSASAKGIAVKWKAPCDVIRQSATFFGLQAHLFLTVEEICG